MPNENKIKKQKQKQKLHQEKAAERRELILYRQKMKSDINKSRIKRDNLLSELTHKLAQAKIKETRLKAKLKEQAIKEKKVLTREKAEDRVEVAKQRKVIREKQNDIQADRKATKAELALTAVEIRNKKLANRKVNMEEKASAKAIRDDQRAKYRQEAAEIKLKNRKLKAELEEKRLIQKNKNAETALEAKQAIVQEKARLAKEKEKLRNLKNEKAAIARAKRLEKTEKAKAQREKIKQDKEKAKELHRQEVLAIKANRISNGQKNAVAINKEKEVAQDEIDTINESIESDRREIIETKVDAKQKIEETKISEPIVQEERVNDFSDKYESAFDEEVIEPKVEQSYTEKIAGSVIHSFGKHGANKFKAAQAPSVDTDISKYKKDIIATEMIEEFRKLSPEAIKVKSLVGYMEILLDKEFTPEQVDQFHAHAITALLTNHSIRFADGFIMPLRNGKKLVLEFAKNLDEGKSLVEFENPEVGETINKIITKKINAGGNILLANGLLAVKENEGIQLLQDTNFMKA